MRRYTQEQKKFIAENIVGRRRKELLAMVNKKFDLGMTLSQLTSYLKNNKLTSGVKTGCSKPTIFTKEVLGFIKKNFKGIGNAELADMVNNNFNLELNSGQIKSVKNSNNLDSGITGRFEKGCVSPRKGKKFTKGGKATRFKKGCRPINYRLIGSERTRKDGYIEVKVEDSKKWKFKHIVIWEKHNKTVPKGHVVVFGDRDKQNFNINNLILVSKKQLLGLNRNNLIQTDADLTRTAIIITDLQSKISERRIK